MRRTEGIRGTVGRMRTVVTGVEVLSCQAVGKGGAATVWESKRGKVWGREETEGDQRHRWEDETVVTGVEVAMLSAVEGGAATVVGGEGERPEEVEGWTIRAAIGGDEEEFEISDEEYDEASIDGVGAGVGSNNKETEERRQECIVGENVDLYDDREIMDSDNEVQEDMCQAELIIGIFFTFPQNTEFENEDVNEVGNLDEIQMNTEFGNEAVNGVEQNERIEIQINIEGENEVMNGFEAGLEGQTGNEAGNEPVNGLEGLTGNEVGNEPVN
nr:uncharacterized protein LOC109160617 [Ipomoea batatas]